MLVNEIDELVLRDSSGSPRPNVSDRRIPRSPVFDIGDSSPWISAPEPGGQRERPVSAAPTYGWLFERKHGGVRGRTPRAGFVAVPRVQRSVGLALRRTPRTKQRIVEVRVLARRQRRTSATRRCCTATTSFGQRALSSRRDVRARAGHHRLVPAGANKRDDRIVGAERRLLASRRPRGCGADPAAALASVHVSDSVALEGTPRATRSGRWRPRCSRCAMRLMAKRHRLRGRSSTRRECVVSF